MTKMNYQPQLGDYGCVSGKGIIPFLIQVGTLTKYNHAFIYVGDGTIAEAMPGGVRLSPVTKYRNIAWNRNEVKSDEQRKTIVAEALASLGNRYSFLAYVAILIRMAKLPAPKWLTNRLTLSKNEICSQLVARAYLKAGISIEREKPNFYTTPSDLIYRLLYI